MVVVSAERACVESYARLPLALCMHVLVNIKIPVKKRICLFVLPAVKCRYELRSK